MPSIKPSFPFQSRQIDRKAWCHQFRKKKRSLPLLFRDIIPAREGGELYGEKIETESNNTSLCERQKMKPPSLTFHFSPDRDKKKKNLSAGIEGGKDKTKQKEKKKKSLYLNHCKALRSFSLIRTDLSG